MPERRNPVVRTGAILRKGGVHTKSVSGQRHRQRIRIDDAIDEWFEDTRDIEDSPADTRAQHLEKREADRHQNGKHAKGQPKAAPFDFCRSKPSPGQAQYHQQK